MFPRHFRQIGGWKKGWSLKRLAEARRRKGLSRLAGERLESRCYLTAASTPGDPIVTVDSNFGNFQLELFPADAPQTVANFLSYVTSGKYNDAVVSRSVPQFVVQTGGITSASTTYTSNSQFVPVPQNAAIPLEYKLPNTAGTIAMARSSSANSATDEWFINVVDNTTNLGPGGVDPNGYAVFGKVLGNGMSIVDAINALSTKNEGSVQTSSTSSTDLSNLPLGPNNELVRISSMALDGIDGAVFTDTNGNGTFDSGESGVAGRTVFINNDNTGKPDSNNPSTTTDANGNYSFTGLAAGSYKVEEVVPSGVALTTATSQTVTVTASGTVSGVNFGEGVPAKITGTVFVDANGNGQLDSGESGVAGRTVFLNNDHTGKPDAQNPSTTTDSSGGFTFDNVAPGPYTVMEVLPANVTLTTPTQSVTVTASHTTSGLLFGERPSITGTVYSDLNLSGTLNSSDPGIGGVTVYLDQNGTGSPTGNPIQITAANGTFAFEGLAPGSYTVREVTPLSAKATSTSSPVTVVAGQITKIDFGNYLNTPLAPLPALTGNSTPSTDANTSFINGVYFRLLGHDPDATGLSYWQQKLAAGASHQSVVQGVWNSAEHLGQIVDQFYQEFLGRSSDPAGKGFWVNLFSFGATDKLEIEGFLTSKEYTNLHASNAAFVDSLYQNIDARGADSQGAGFWQNALSTGQTRLQVAAAFVNGQEATTRLLDAFYADFLHRQPDSSSQQTFVGPLEQQTMTIPGVAAAILGSDEYFNGVARQ